MKHYVLTRSVYGPEWTPEANARRLAVTRAVTARLMALQTFRDWTWIVALHPRDPMLAERKAVFAAAAPEFRPLLWTPKDLGRVPWDPEPRHPASRASLVAATAYRAPWRSLMDPDGMLLQTRIDDDDGFSLTALARYQQAAAKVTVRTVLMLPYGLRVYGSRCQVIAHDKNAMHTLVTFPGDDLGIYDYGHTRCREVAPVKVVDRNWAWIWVRHADTISGWRQTQAPVTDRVRKLFPVDWKVVENAA